MNEAFFFIVLIGILDLFGDMTYEGGRSIIGPFLGTLGASASMISIIAGTGEFLGYALRIVSGWIASRTHYYWLLLFVGYGINLFSLPLLAFVPTWEVAAICIILERIGKAIRTPPRDTLVSYAAGSHLGSAFGLRESLDQCGAILGPLLLALVLYLMPDNYRLSFGLLIIPALLAICFLFFAKKKSPQFQKSEELSLVQDKLALFNSAELFSRQFIFYLIGIGLLGVGHIDFALISYHLHAYQIVSSVSISLLWGTAMGVTAVGAFVMGKLYDYIGAQIIIFATLITMPFALCIFWGGPWGALMGMILWGVAYSCHGSILPSLVSELVPLHTRAAAYGMSSFVFGIGWLMGSIINGFLYETSLLALIIFVILFQILSLPFIYVSLPPKYG